MSKTGRGLVEYAKIQLGRPYWYGTYGNISTQSLYTAKKKQYPNYYTWALISDQIGKRVHDCVGLIKGYLWSDTPESVPKYNGAQDVSANGMFGKCKVSGTIDTLPETPGALVFMQGHVGVYIGGGNVIEARGHAYGVVKTKLKERPWKNWGLCPWIEYTEEKPKEPHKPTLTVDQVAQEVVAGYWGNGIERKKKLEAAGYNYAEVQKRVNELINGGSYFKKCGDQYKSIVDGLASVGAEYSFSYRRKIAKANGITNYVGTAKQNTEMLKLLKDGRLLKP